MLSLLDWFDAVVRILYSTPSFSPCVCAGCVVRTRAKQRTVEAVSGSSEAQHMQCHLSWSLHLIKAKVAIAQKPTYERSPETLSNENRELILCSVFTPCFKAWYPQLHSSLPPPTQE